MASAPQVLFAGDSVLERISRDEEGATLAELVADALRPAATECVSRTGYHAGVYLSLMEEVIVRESRPRLVILPVNLRSFSPQWHGNPMWSFDGRGGEGAPPEAWTAYDATRVECAASSLTTVREFREIVESRPPDAQGQRDRLRHIFTFHYLYRLGADHPHLESWRRILNAARAAGMAPLTYFTPVNHEAGRRYTGPLFAEVVERNKGVVRDALGDVKDFSFLFDSGAFFTPDNATEHLRFEARRALARRIADAGRRILDA